MIISEQVIYTDEELKNEEWRCFHIVTKPQKHYKRGTKLYVSNLGRCKADDKIVNNKPRESGYVNFCCIPVHRLVYKLFISPNIDGLDVDHIDRNRLNNRVSNLRACTRKENMLNINTRQHLKEMFNKQKYKDFQRQNNVGRKWINNGKIRKKLFPEDCIKYINEGWKYGFNF